MGPLVSGVTQNADVFCSNSYAPSGVRSEARYIHVMATQRHSFKCIVTALTLTFASTPLVVAQQTGLDGLYQELFEADENSHARIAERISKRLERSGSPAMDLLYRRGVDALESDDATLDCTFICQADTVNIF